MSEKIIIYDACFIQLAVGKLLRPMGPNVRKLTIYNIVTLDNLEFFCDSIQYKLLLMYFY